MHPDIMMMLARQHTQELLAEAAQERLASQVMRARRARGEADGSLSSLVQRVLARLWTGQESAGGALPSPSRP
jgi:hypothetical protein